MSLFDSCHKKNSDTWERDPKYRSKYVFTLNMTLKHIREIRKMFSRKHHINILNLVINGWDSKKGKIKYTLELSVKSPCLHPIFGPAFKPLSPLSVVSAKKWGERKDSMKLSLLPKLVEIYIVWVPVISLCIQSFHSLLLWVWEYET
jgi:hypothetical protein